MNRKLPQIESQICVRLHTMKNFIVSKTYSAPVAQDIYAEACVMIWTKIRNGKFRDDGGSLDSFMWWCARNAINDYHRKEKRFNNFARNEYAHYHGIFAKNSEREYELAMENRLFIRKGMKKVSVVCRKILLLLLFQNMKLSEIGEILNMPSSTVSQYLRGMRSKFGVHLCRAKAQKGALDVTAGGRGRWLMKKIGGLDG